MGFIRLIIISILLVSCGPPQHSRNPQVGAGSALLSWQPPTENTDGTPLTDLTEYAIVYGIDGALDQELIISAPGITSYMITDLPPGYYSFYLEAINSLGIRSAPSNIVSKEIL